MVPRLGRLECDEIHFLIVCYEEKPIIQFVQFGEAPCGIIVPDELLQAARHVS